VPVGVAEHRRWGVGCEGRAGDWVGDWDVAAGLSLLFLPGSVRVLLLWHCRRKVTWRRCDTILFSLPNQKSMSASFKKFG